MISEVEFYQLAAPVFGLITLALGVWTYRLSPRTRTFGLAMVASSAAITLGYVLMAQGILTVEFEDGTTAYARFIGYFVAFSIIYPVMWRIADGSVLVLVMLLFAHVSWISSTIISWSTEGSLALAGTLGIFLSFLLLMFVLLGPLSSQAGRVSGERRLLFGKLRNLVALILVMFLVNGILTDSGMGLLDTFVGVFIGIYTDVLLIAGFSAILLRSRTALEQLTPANDGDRGDRGDDTDVTIGEPAGTPAE